MTDPVARKGELENEQRYIQAWLDHPLTKELLASYELSAENLSTLVLEAQIKDLPSLIAHFEVRGHRQGVLQAKRCITARLSEIEQELESL